MIVEDLTTLFCVCGFLWGDEGGVYYEFWLDMDNEWLYCLNL